MTSFLMNCGVDCAKHMSRHQRKHLFRYLILLDCILSLWLHLIRHEYISFPPPVSSSTHLLLCRHVGFACCSCAKTRLKLHSEHEWKRMNETHLMIVVRFNSFKCWQATLKTLLCWNEIHRRKLYLFAVRDLGVSVVALAMDSNLMEVQCVSSLWSVHLQSCANPTDRRYSSTQEGTGYVPFSM